MYCFDLLSWCDDHLFHTSAILQGSSWASSRKLTDALTGTPGGTWWGGEGQPADLKRLKSDWKFQSYFAPQWTVMLEAILCQTKKRLIVRWLIVIWKKKKNQINKQTFDCELINCDLKQTFGCELIDWDVKKTNNPWLWIDYLWFDKKQTFDYDLKRNKQTDKVLIVRMKPAARTQRQELLRTRCSPDKRPSLAFASSVSVSSAAADWFARYLHLFLALHYLIYCTDFLYFPECPSAAARQGQRTCRPRWKRSGTATRLDLSWGNVKAVRRGEE